MSAGALACATSMRVATVTILDAESGALAGRDSDPFRDDRHRISPLLAWQVSDYSRLRLQYNYDHADHLADDDHTIWLGCEIMIGSYSAHGH